MDVCIYSTKNYEKSFLDKAFSSESHKIQYVSDRLNKETAFLSKGSEAICCFVTDSLDAETLVLLKEQGAKLIVLRSAGYDHVDLNKAKLLGLTVVRVPSYSPHSIAEYSVGLILALSRKIPRAHDRVRSHNFSLEGEVGFNIHGRTLGVIGTGKIGEKFIKIVTGFGCKILAYDPNPNAYCQSLGVEYVPLKKLFMMSDIVSLHCLLTDQTRHIVNHESLALMKSGAMLINTGRGALVDTAALIESLKAQKLHSVGIDVYENEANVFFKDCSDEVIQDDQFVRLQAFSNVIITGHQAYCTIEALSNIAETTVDNITAYENGHIKNAV